MLDEGPTVNVSERVVTRLLVWPVMSNICTLSAISTVRLEKFLTVIVMFSVWPGRMRF